MDDVFRPSISDGTYKTPASSSQLEPSMEWEGRKSHLQPGCYWHVLAVRKGGVEFSVWILQWVMCTSVEDQNIRDDLGIPNWKTEDSG